MKEILKKSVAYAAIVALFIVLAYAFVPQILGGKIVNQSDISGWQGMAKESQDWNRENPDDKTQWSGSMFCGMPNVTFIDEFSGDLTKPLYKALLWGKRPGSYLFLALLGGFLMMLAFGVNKWLAVIGAVAVAFCSYNLQIIQVGHNTKMQAIAFAPWAIAAFVWTYRKALEAGREHLALKKWLPSVITGSVLFGLAISMQIKANHVQITYYLAIILVIYAIGQLIWCLGKKNRWLLGRFAAASGLLLLLGVLGIGTNADKLIPTAEYAPYTMRGGSELTKDGSNDKGLSLDYATAWSYGIEETPNLLIPNYNGGSSSGAVGEKSATWQLFKRAGQNPRGVCSALPLYWGPQPFTAGPMYLGAISIFLFVLGLFLCRGREKWWIVACTVLAVLLAWGNHLMWFTRLWFEYAPMYNKFRTVSMALVILQFVVPILGVYTLDRILKNEFDGRKVVRSVWWSLGITAGFCLVTALLPSLAGSFTAPSDSSIQGIIADALRADRESLLKADAWRSFLLILAAAGAIVWSYFKPDTRVVSKRLGIAAGVIGVLVLVDLWAVGKRYLNDSHFTTPRDFSAALAEREVDREILKDSDPSYRVLDLSESTFNSSVTSYRHKSIGGYSPTKMQRYQDLIDHYLSGEISSFYRSAGKAQTLGQMQEAVPYMPVLSMLNARYIIVDGSLPPLVNPSAMGSAWFVGNVAEAANPDEEIALLGAVDPAKTAVVRTPAPEFTPSEDAVIMMTSYAPNELRYTYNSPTDALAVFSEIYHPSWKAWILPFGSSDADVHEAGTELELFAADWVLRGAVLPAGSGEIVMRYEPADYAKGARLSLICSIVLLMFLIISAGYRFAFSKKIL